ELLSLNRHLIYEQYYDTLFACEQMLKIWQAVFHDENYLWYHNRIWSIYKTMAEVYAHRGERENALSALRKAFHHAREFDGFPEGEHYTNMFLSALTSGREHTMKGYAETDTELLRHNARESAAFESLRGDPEFEALLESGE
ncbi:MAG: hypothetical protein LBC28_00015, partial [Oscillospiraceae bacterium]|nr:hypothetical protein [Oscillospiraceae bacterium]